MQKPPISGADYQRIFRTAYSIVEPDHPEPTKACYHINSIAALILQKYYGIDARPVVGFAAYLLGERPRNMVVFGNLDGNRIDRDGPDSHCWVTTEEWHIDFMAPLFPEIAYKGELPPCKPKMMCKPVRLAKGSMNELVHSGDFFEWPHEEKTKRELGSVFEKPLFKDLSNIACLWFRKPPEPMRKSIPIKKDDGEIYEVELTPKGIVGSW